MNQENSHHIDDGIGDGYYLTCLCGIHKEDSTCEVYLRNTGNYVEMTDAEKTHLHKKILQVIDGGDVCIGCEA